MSSIPASVIATAAKQLSKAAAWQQYQKDRAQAEQLFDEYAAQGHSGYFIHDAGQKESCQTCLAHDGQYFEFTAESRQDHLPPFHPNCECSIDLAEQEKPVPYDVETGLIGSGATRELIVNELNQALSINTNWVTVAMVSDFKTGDPAELVDEYTAPDASTPRIDTELRQEFEAIKKELESYKDDWEWFFKKPGYALSVGPDMPFDLKARIDGFWGIDGSTGGRKHWAYIFEEKLLRYDQPGNILAGWAAAYVGISLEDVLYWAAVDSGGADDIMDINYIKKGYNLYR